MDRKIILLLLFLFLLSNASADLIDNYAVTNPVPLNQELSISGSFIDDLNNNVNVLCSFFIVDVNNSEEKLYRLTDEYTNSKGTFYGKTIVREPRLKRGEFYTVLTVCGDAEAEAVFLVGQRDTVFQPLLQEFQFFTDTGNVLPIIYLGILAFIFIIVPFTVIVWFRHRGRSK